MRRLRLPTASLAYGPASPRSPWPEIDGFDAQLQAAVTNITVFRRPFWDGLQWRMSAEGEAEQWLARQADEQVRRLAQRRPLDRIYRLDWTSQQREIMPGPGYFYGVITQYIFHRGAPTIRYVVVGFSPYVHAAGCWPGTARRPLVLPSDADLIDVTDEAKKSHAALGIRPDFSESSAAWRADTLNYRVWADALPRQP